jgi:hypothetical protein
LLSSLSSLQACFQLCARMDCQDAVMWRSWLEGGAVACQQEV